METLKLHEWFNELIVGETLNRKVQSEDEFKEGYIKVLSPKALCEGYIDDDSIGYYSLLENKKPIKKNKFTKLNDVVVKMTPPYTAALIDKNHCDLLVPQFCLILRGIKPIFTTEYSDFKEKSSVFKKHTGEDINLSFITTFLNSKLLKEQLESLSSSDIKSISKQIIGNLDIPVCSVTNKQRINEAFKYLSNTIRITRKILNYQNEYMDALLDDTLSDAITDELYVKTLINVIGEDYHD